MRNVIITSLAALCIILAFAAIIYGIYSIGQWVGSLSLFILIGTIFYLITQLDSK